MSLNVATLITCILFSGCLSELTGENKLPNNVEKRVREVHTQDEVGYDPYSDWFNNAQDTNTQEDVNTADESPVDRQGQNDNDLSWGKVEEQEDDEASDSDEWDWGEVKKQGDDENMDSKPSDDVDDIMIQFFNHPGDPKVQEEVDWNDRDFLKEEVEKAKKQGVYLDDQNDDKSIFQNKAWNSIWDDDSNVEQQSNDEDSDDDSRVEQQSNDGNLENSYFETEGKEQEKLRHEQPNTANGQMFEKNFNTNNNIENLWNELNGMQRVETQNNAEDRINRQIDATQNETEEVEKKLAHALDEEKKAQSLIRCKTKMGYDEGCRMRKELTIKKLADKVKEYTAQLEALGKRLLQLSEKLQKAQNSGGK